jgi:hypothetical protein
MSRPVTLDSHRINRHLRAFLLAALVLATFVSTASADLPIGSQGGGNGQTDDPGGVAVDSSNGNIVIADSGNRRVDLFDADGDFIRAFGWGVVASGPGNDPRNQIEKVTVNATGGSFVLLFVQNSNQTKGLIQQETRAMPFNSPASELTSALEALPGIEPGDIGVSGATGGPWTIEFTGVYADTNMHKLEGIATGLTGGAKTVTTETLQPGANYEVCEAADGDVCQPGQQGAAPGQMHPTSIAVDPASNHIYVFDGLESFSYNEAFNNRVQAFTADGEFLFMVGGGVNQGPIHPGNLCTVTHITEGDVCVGGANGTGAGQFNQEISAVAVGPGGVLHVNDGGRVQKFSSAGALSGQVTLAGALRGRLAVDSAGNLFVFGTAVRKYDPTGTTLLKELPIGSNLGALAVDVGDDLYLAENASGEHEIAKYDGVTLAQLSSFYLAGGQRATALAPNAAGDGILAVAPGLFGPLSGVTEVPLPPPGPVVYPPPSQSFASAVGNVKATLNAKVNPEGKATTFHFEYITDADFKASGNSFGAGTVSTTESASIGSDFILHPVTAPLTGLTPETLYHFRAAATNVDGGPRLGPLSTFETKPPVEFGPAWSTEVGTDAALLHAEINPLGILAIGRFEYVEQAVFDVSGYASAAKAPIESAAAINFGEGEAFKEGTAQAYPLKAGTVYRYRLIATDRCKPEPEPLCDFPSAEGTVRTFKAPVAPAPCANDEFRSGPGVFLPDCRAYEMVSPDDKNGSNVEAVSNITGFPASYEQAATDGGSITYSTYKAFGDVASAPYTNQYLGRRDEDKGWLTEAISPKREGPSVITNESLELDRQYKAFSPDLCSGWVVQDAKPILAPDGIPGYGGLYRRDNCGAGTGSYETLTTVAPPNLGPRRFIATVQGFSADGLTTLFMAADNLAEPTAPQPLGCIETEVGCQQRLYEANAGSLEAICILPGGAPVTTPCGAGLSSLEERRSSQANAISDDGSRIFWTAFSGLFGGGSGKLYVRIDGSETVNISEDPAVFWAAAADGSKAIYTVGGKLFEFDVEAKAASLIAEGVSGVAGASEDASRLYFVSSQELVPGKGEAGKPNFYRYEEGSGFKFVATLASGDFSGLVSPISLGPSNRTARMSPDGEQIAFMSVGRLTGYDNTDAASKQADAEVFLYDATADGGAGKLICASCNPSGVRPTGQPLPQLQGAPSLLWAAARIPYFESSLYGQRVLSEDGRRLYFNSHEGLVSRDTNGQEDVYQWEAVGSGSCQSTASPSYSPPNGGCLDLISSGESPNGSELVDIGTNGDDVFFKTSSGLLPQDSGLIDIYDARVNGGFPLPENPPAPCEGEACAPPAVAPNDPTPSSSAFHGAGNPAPEGKPRKGCAKGRRKVRRAGKTRCVRRGGKGKTPRRKAAGGQRH